MAGMITSVHIFTTLLPTGEYGRLMLCLTAGILVNQVLLGGINNAVARFYSVALDAGDLKRYLRSMRALFIRSMAMVLALGLTCIGLLVVAGWLGGSGAGAAIMALSLALLSGANACLTGLQNAARQRRIAALHTGVESWTRLMLGAGFGYLVEPSATAVLAGMNVSMLLCLISQRHWIGTIVAAQDRASDGTAQDWEAMAWDFARPFAMFGAFTALHLVSDRWTIEHVVGTAAVATYAVAYQLGYAPINQLSTMASTLLAPILYLQHSRDHQPERARQTTIRCAWAALACTGLLGALAWLAAPWIIGVLTPADYAGSSALIPILAVAAGLFATGQILALHLMVGMNTRALNAIKIGTALLGIAANITGALLAGITGVAVASLAFSIVYAGLCACILHRAGSRRIDSRNPVTDHDLVA